jgi:ABC-type uncharacterized transport system YnjBCD substrate-binding protein
LLVDKLIAYIDSLDIIKKPKRLVEGYAKVPGMQRSPFASCGTSFNIITKGMQRFWYAKVPLCIKRYQFSSIPGIINAV